MPNFTQPPDWEWWILLYFFIGGICSGMFILAGVIRLARPTLDRRLTRPAFLAAFPLIVLSPIFLTVDLGNPERFLNMLFNFGDGYLPLKVWSPMSLGALFLFVFGGCVTLMFINEILAMRGERQGSRSVGAMAAQKRWLGFLPLHATLETVVLWVGVISGVTVAGYTGVLLNVSNQPVWGDTWVIGALFTASALSTGAATFWLLLWPQRKVTAGMMEWLAEVDAYFIILEMIILGILLLTLGDASSRLVAGYYGLLLWIGVFAMGILGPLALHFSLRWISPSVRIRLFLVAGLLVLVGGFILRYVVIFAPQIPG